MQNEFSNKLIDFSKSVYDLSKEYPEIIDIMRELGFDSIASPGMLNTTGRFMTIPKGAVMKKIEMGIIKEEFIKRGFSIKE